MKLFAAAASAVVTIAAGLLLTSPSASAANLVANPGFESGLSNWSCSLGSTVSSPVHSGSAALAGAANNSDNAQCTQTVSVLANTAYTLSGWVRGNYVYIGVTGGASTWTPSATTYTKLSVPFTTGAGQTSVQIFLHGWYAQGTYNADDISLDGPGNPPPTTSQPPTTGPAVPGKPGNPSITSVTNTSLGLSWGASTGTVSGYRVYEGTTQRAQVTGTSTTITGLGTCSTHTYTVKAFNGAGESAASNSVTGTTSGCQTGGKHAWPYIDITMSSPSMVSVANATGHKFFTLAFVLGSSQGCVPAWGGQTPLNEPRIINDINAIRSMGGDMKIAFGGAVAPYLEGSCTSVNSLAAAYEQVIDVTGVRHLDIDIEASFNIDQMNKALAKVQAERSGTTVSFTLMVVGDTYGIIDSLGVDVLKNAKANGVNVSTVNPMTMDFGPSAPNWGDAVIGAATKTLEQMATIWPEKTDAQRKAMLGVTPMIGRNDTGPIFTQTHANQLRSWASSNHIDSIAFWSVGRDNGGCPGGGVSPTCSSISQSLYEFTNIFKGFTG
jgi:hypothetical protein